VRDNPDHHGWQHHPADLGAVLLVPGAGDPVNDAAAALEAARAQAAADLAAANAAAAAIRETADALAALQEGEE